MSLLLRRLSMVLPLRLLRLLLAPRSRRSLVKLVQPSHSLQVKPLLALPLHLLLLQARLLVLMLLVLRLRRMEVRRVTDDEMNADRDNQQERPQHLHHHRLQHHHSKKTTDVCRISNIRCSRNMIVTA